MQNDVAATPTDDLANSAIRAEMARRRVTQGALAAALNISQAQVSARLNGSVDWRLSELVVVSHVLGVHVTELLRDAA